MKPKRIFALLCLCWPMLGLGEEPFTLSRLKSPPDAITEKFFRVGKAGVVEVEGPVISKMHLQVEEGKSHARLVVFHANKTSKAVSPNYTVRFYNPYGILMGGIRVPVDGKVPEGEIPPGEDRAKVLMPRVTRLDAIFKHADFKSYPADFFAVRWLSISDAEIEGDAGGGQPAKGADPKAEEVDKPKPGPEPEDR